MNKETSLKSAVTNYTNPHDTIHLRLGYDFPFASVNELTRQYKDSDAAFTFVCAGTDEWGGPPIYTGIVDKLVTSFVGYAYPYPGINEVAHQKILAGDIEVEDWSLYTIIQRLWCGALDLPFCPTNSIANSSLGNTTDTAVIKSPFKKDHNENETTVVAPIQPDVSFIHGIVADKDGNVVCSPPGIEGIWGCYASDTVVATVERVVDTEAIQQYGHTVTFPEHLVDAVIEVPFGSHPKPLYNPYGIGNVQGYDFDRQFQMAMRNASRSSEDFEAWLNEWVYGVTHQEYLEKVGKEQLYRLIRRHDLDNSQREAISEPVNGTRSNEPPSDTERMIVQASEELAKRVGAGDHDVLFAGIGVSHIAAYAYQQSSDVQDVDKVPLLVEAGIYGFEAESDDAYVFPTAALPSAKVISNTTFALGAVMGSPGANTLAVLSGAEVDCEGNVNSSRLRGEYFLGSGGANDSLSTADEVVLVLEASPNRLVESVEFVTGPGSAVSTVVTQYGILRKYNGVLQIDAVYSGSNAESDERLETFKENIGWNARVSEDVKHIEWGQQQNKLLEQIRDIDPHGDFRK